MGYLIDKAELADPGCEQIRVWKVEAVHEWQADRSGCPMHMPAMFGSGYAYECNSQKKVWPQEHAFEPSR